MPEFSQTTPLGNGDSVTIIKQMGKTGAFRSYRYGVEEPWFFYHLGENMIKAEFADSWSRIVFRVKPAADGPDYREKFLREIAYSPPPFGDSSTDGDGQYAWRCVSFTDR